MNPHESPHREKGQRKETGPSRYELLQEWKAKKEAAKKQQKKSIAVHTPQDINRILNRYKTQSKSSREGALKSKKMLKKLALQKPVRFNRFVGFHLTYRFISGNLAASQLLGR